MSLVRVITLFTFPQVIITCNCDIFRDFKRKCDFYSKIKYFGTHCGAFINENDEEATMIFTDEGATMCAEIFDL